MTTLESPQQSTLPASISERAGFLLALILPIFAVAPLFYPGYFQTHTGLTPLWNLIDLRANLFNWGWWPHVVVQFEPLRSTGLLPYFVAGLLPVNPVVALKGLIGLAWVLGSVGMYLWLKHWLGRPGALLAALVYTYLPYQITAAYVRGAWGESIFWGGLPWALLASNYLVASPRPSVFVVAALAWLALALTQLGLALWALLFIVLLLLAVHPRQAVLPVASAAVGTGVVILLYWAISASLAPPLVNFGDHFLYPFQLFLAFWGFGPSRPGWNDGLSLQLGLAALGLTIVSIAVWQQQPAGSDVSRTDRRLIFFSSAAVLLILLQVGVTAWVWTVPILPGHPLAETLTYPWQLLGLTGLCLAILAGATVWFDTRLARLPLWAGLVILVTLSSYVYLLPHFIQVQPYLAGPQAIWGDNQLTLVEHHFSVTVSGNTAGLGRGAAEIPLTASGLPQADDLLVLHVTWHPLRPFEQNLKVFAHLVDANGQVLAQFDGYPRSGDYPTSDWLPGELIEDAYPLRLPTDAPVGPYRLYLGLYDEATMTRLPVPTDTEGRAILDVQ